MSDSSDESPRTAGSQNGDNVTTRKIKKMRPSPASMRHENESTAARRPKINLKVPPFSPEDPEIWFALLEGQFTNFGIEDDETKFTQVTVNLDLVHAREVKDIIINPPAQNRYQKIKTELIRRLTASHEKKVRQLLTHEVLGDRKPSQFLRHLQDLAGPSVPADFVKTIWCQRLPSNVQTVLASQPSLSPEQLADLADNIQDIVSPCNVAATSSTHGSNISDEIAELRRMVEQLAVKVDEQARSFRAQAPGRSRRHESARHRSRSRPRSRSTSDHRKYPVCWYHHTFGSKASKCIKPCEFTGNGRDSR